MVALLAAFGINLYPMPDTVRRGACTEVATPRTVARDVDPGALDEVNDRWSHLGVGTLRRADGATIRFVRNSAIPSQAYQLAVASGRVTITSGDADGAFYGMMTLGQLARRDGGRWVLPCVDIDDAPKLKWRILSDDVSRGPLPTMSYFKERIRTIAAFKMNGYSPYMEHVFKGGRDTLAAPDDGITPDELRELVRYAKRFHVTLIPEQQTYAHMHGTLRIEEYADGAAFPHGFLMFGQERYQSHLDQLIRFEQGVVGPTPFFHIGSDEPSMLGEGTTAEYVQQHGGKGAVFAAHVQYWVKVVAPSRVMLWDDAIEQDPSIMAALPKSAVILNWHYGAEPSYQKYITLIASGGFEQMVAPGASNWNEIYPDVLTAIPNETVFIKEGIKNHVLGLFQTVWHDDGETLYESTWYPVLYAGALAWSGDEKKLTDDAFTEAFFGENLPTTVGGLLELGRLDKMLGRSTNKLSWANPFAPEADALTDEQLKRARLDAEDAIDNFEHVPPLHASTARAMLLAAKRYDALGRRYQIAREIRFYYDHAQKNPNDAVRDLFWCKYWFWEQRDMDEELAKLYEQAWRYESRDGHLASNLERFHLDAQRAIENADAIDRVTYQVYLKTKILPPLNSVIK